MPGHSSRLIKVLLFIGCLIITVGVITSSGETVEWNFESGTDFWQPLTGSLKITRIKDDGATEKSTACLRIKGSGQGYENYAVSEPYPMTTRQFFRFSAWVKINNPGAFTPPPCLKCIFEAEKPGTYLGQALSENYDTSKPATWQRLEGECRVPYGTYRGKLALGYETNPKDKQDFDGDIDICLDDVTLEPIDHYTIDDKYYLEPLPASLEKFRGIHPRIYLTDARITELRRVIKTTHASIWEEIIKQADSVLKKNPPEYMDERKFSNIEQLYMRGVGDNMPFLAIAWVMTQDRKYLDGAKKWALAACNYPTWGLYEFANVDLSTGHQLYWLALVYDWCYHDLDRDTRRIICETLRDKSTFLFDVAAKGIIVKDPEAYKAHPWPEWDEAYLQNHMWINSCGLATAGMAIFDEEREANRWIAFTLDRYRRTMDVLGNDGASHEGPGYWSYGVEWMLKFMCPARNLLGVDMFDCDWWRNTTKYRLYMALPQNSWTYDNSTIDVGDSRRYDWYGPDYMLRKLASEYRDGYAQWLASELDKTGTEHPIARWLNLLWYDPSVELKPPSGLPTLHHFTDMDIVTARSDWSGDESFIFFKCGPYIGHTAIREFTYCPSSAHHVHPDTGNFVLFGEGEWLVREDGYRAKYTGYHNTLLIDNSEQLGGGYPIFNGAEPHGSQACPRIISAVSTPELDRITGDATEAYPQDIGLSHYIRHLLFIKPDILIVIDDVALDHVENLELRFHPEQQEAERIGDVFLMQGEKAILRLDPLTKEDIEVNAEKLVTLPKEKDGKEELMYTVRLRTQKKNWRNATALSWSSADKQPERVLLEEDGTNWIFNTGSRMVTFDWETGNAVLK
ncbi:MAG: DUF4962 domain-containing protein [Candidatus Latescibacteria bacterium]|nr:DUF4962 domain-containing protein [Candidatus Latescibacterota bacterium]